MTTIKRLIVSGLCHACGVVDKLPNWTHPFVGRWIGCPNGMALWSFNLDDKWQTGAWEDASTHECNAGDFDRTLCGCGSMHSYCDICADLQDDCPLA